MTKYTEIQKQDLVKQYENEIWKKCKCTLDSPLSNKLESIKICMKNMEYMPVVEF